jgi:hypothetical protein
VGRRQAIAMAQGFPTLIALPGVFVAMRIGVIDADPSLATNAVWPSG